MGGGAISGVVLHYLTYEYLPGTAENRKLADIRARHPDAIER